ncbi:MAG: sulfur carrier protein ThiS adenylyltransferase ThiF [Anaerolineales bacterium]|nr:sulfur carrier protein ThiS adenylyltransferase ThiF [Anaerolineales bacterium]
MTPGLFPIYQFPNFPISHSTTLPIYRPTNLPISHPHLIQTPLYAILGAMIKITFNERPIEIDPGTTLYRLVERFKPGADVLVVNGFPVSEDGELAEGDRVALIKRGERPDSDELEALMAARHTPGVHDRLKQSCVGIAGCGGLGSNVALSLARVGVGKLIIADFDVVIPSNLNRQQYFIEQIGQFKVDALKETLARANPFVQVEIHRVELTAENIPRLFAGADVIVEAFDRVDMKVMIIETVLVKMPDTPLVVGSGMAGYGRNNDIQTQREGNLYICGDGVSDARPGRGLMAPRVGIAANHQANQVLEIILGEEPE